MSYSQRGEDLTIHRLLGYPNSPGFYIDVGAHHPLQETVTRFFYEKGWTGINIEPQESYYQLLVAHRKNDINLQVAIGSSEGTAELRLNHGLSTLVKNYARPEWPVITVALKTLKSICQTYVGSRQIDFLKIDVEGYEREVILGADWANYRPKVICIESTVPMTDIPSYQEWEDLLVNVGYTYTEKDIANRYYINTGV